MARMAWAMIRDALAEDITTGALKAGAQVPTAPQLVARFPAGQHSVRKAVEALAREGKLSIEQGAAHSWRPRRASPMPLAS
ncbi:MAG: GntR family transcriptional regulator, partial [Pseudomonadota bacterium]